jgi:1,2-phenylacetyl-CoA epoxidase PaaB subunit
MSFSVKTPFEYEEEYRAEASRTGRDFFTRERRAEARSVWAKREAGQSVEAGQPREAGSLLEMGQPSPVHHPPHIYSR